jgi:polyisoprenyl-phosphate glycosyltransferase
MTGAPASGVPDFSIVIPVYNSAATLVELSERLDTVFEGLGRSFEIIFVDDGSKDESWARLKEVRERRPERVTAIQLMRNFGQHNALMCGFRHTRGEFVITMDDDLQNPPEEIPKLIRAIEEEGLDLVYGGYGEKKHKPWRNLGSAVVRGFYRIVFQSSVNLTSFRIIRRQLLESIFTYALNFTFVDGLLAWNSQRISEVRVEHKEREQGRSGYSIPRLLRLAFNLFTNFSLIPLQFVSGVGSLVAFSGILAGFYYLYKYFTSQIAVSGYASIIVAVLILGGVQLIALGIIGEYLGRLHMNVNRKPQYVERHILAGPSGPHA